MKISRWILGLFLAISLVGFTDATYLTIKHYQGAALECSIFEGCEKVTTSRYATVAGVPIALAGALYYLAIFLALIAYIDLKKEKILIYASRMTILGFLASVWFVYVQLFVIRAICPWCMVSAAASTALFILGVIVLRSGSVPSGSAA